MTACFPIMLYSSGPRLLEASGFSVTCFVHGFVALLVFLFDLIVLVALVLA